MRIDVSELLRHVGEEREVDIEEEVSFPDDSLTLTQPLKGHVRLVNTGPTVLLTGKVSTALKVSCVRCLKDFLYPIKIDLEEQYRKGPSQVSERGKEIELKEDDFIFPIEEDNTIDLTEAVRQNLLVALPLNPLCRTDCKGIEIKEIKETKEKTIDKRWEKLKEFRKGK